jgi:hypothetical protein
MLNVGYRILVIGVYACINDTTGIACWQVADKVTVTVPSLVEDTEKSRGCDDKQSGV